MDKLFLTILNMSLTGIFVIAAILLMRLLFKKAPKIISYCLWIAAGFRLLFPFYINSIISLIPFKSAPIPQDIAMQPIPRIESGITFVDNAVSSILPIGTPYSSVNPLQVWMAIASFIWLLGVIAILTYGIVSYFLLKRKMRNAEFLKENIYKAYNIQSPFLLGVIDTRIYIPAILTEKEKDCVILHEKVHIRRHDHIIKYIAYKLWCWWKNSDWLFWNSWLYWIKKYCLLSPVLRYIYIRFTWNFL